MATPFRCDLITPERSLFGGDADEVSMRTEVGEITFLAHHEDFVGAADVTVVRIHAASGEGADSEATWVRVAVHGGVVHVDHDGLTVFAAVAEIGTDIDVERARRALTRAEERLAAENDGHGDEQGDAERGRGGASADAAVRRARARLEAAGADQAA